jgi:REP element-mobilizing transposase RayT
MARDEWLHTATARADVTLDEFVVMPNHIHAIIFITSNTNESPVGATRRVALSDGSSTLDNKANTICCADANRATRRVAPTGPLRGSLSAIVGQYKARVTKQIHSYRIEHNLPSACVWQRSFYERVIRDENELDKIRRYIIENPLHWDDDSENMSSLKMAGQNSS